MKVDTGYFDTLRAELDGLLSGGAGRRPPFPGYAVLVGSGDQVLFRAAGGHAVRYADAEGNELPPARQVPITPDTIFDLASLSKLFTSIAAMQQVERGRIELDAPVATYLPRFATAGKGAVTVAHLLTHTSGLPAWHRLWGYPDYDARVRAVLEAAPAFPPDTQYIYSDLNLITLGFLIEEVGGRPLDVVVREEITEPLGMSDTGYNPPPERLDRVAATEYQAEPGRGLVRGVVHDENAWSLGGVAGHAGVFSTIDDLALLSRALLSGGRSAPAVVLNAATVESMVTDHNRTLPSRAHGLGFDLDQPWYMGALSSPFTAGHTGFTGTCLLLDFRSGTYVLMASNRVHPRREWSGVNHVRRLVARRVVEALGLEPASADPTWRCDGESDGGSGAPSVELPLELRETPTRLAYDLMLENEHVESVALECSRDGGDSWEEVPFITSSRGLVSQYDGPPLADFAGRHWQQVSARLDGEPGPIRLRWRYIASGGLGSTGGGVLLSRIRVADRGGALPIHDLEPTQSRPTE